MRPPAVLRIGPQEWRVVVREIDADPALYGRTVEKQLTLLLGPAQAPGQLRETLLHELLHACWSKTVLDELDDDEQERVVGSLSPWLLGALRDNPRLVAFLLAE